MSKTFKHQDTYDYLHHNKEVTGRRLIKLLEYFDRINIGKDWLSKWHRYKVNHKTPIE